MRLLKLLLNIDLKHLQLSDNANGICVGCIKSKEPSRSQHICGDSVFTIFSSHSSISVETVRKVGYQEFYT